MNADMTKTFIIACKVGCLISHRHPCSGCPSEIRTCDRRNDPSFPSKRATATFTLTASLDMGCPG